MAWRSQIARVLPLLSVLRHRCNLSPLPASAQPTRGTEALLLAGHPHQHTRQVPRLVGRLVGVPLRLRVTTHPGAPTDVPRTLERWVGGRLHSFPALVASPAPSHGRRGYARCCNACNRVRRTTGARHIRQLSRPCRTLGGQSTH